MSEIDPDDIHIDWHNAAEHVLQGKLRSAVTFTEFRQLMGGERTAYIPDEELLALYRLHTQVPYLGLIEQMDPERIITPVDHEVVPPKIPFIDTSGSMLGPYVGPQLCGGCGQVTYRRSDENCNNCGLSPLLGNAAARMESFVEVARRTERETKPPLSRRAKKALRRAKRRLRRHA